MEARVPLAAAALPLHCCLQTAVAMRCSIRHEQQQRLPWHAWTPFGCNTRDAPCPFYFLAGVTDHLAENEPHALSLARSILANVNSPGHAGMASPWGQQQAAAQQLAAAAAAAVAAEGGGSHAPAAAAAAAHAWEEPRFLPDELRGKAVFGTLSVTAGNTRAAAGSRHSDLPHRLLPCTTALSPTAAGVIPADPKQPFDVRAVLARLLDGSRFHEFKAQVGR